MHGGGRGSALLSDGSDLLPSSDKSVERVSWKLEPRLRHLGNGLSSLESPSWNVDARRRLDVQEFGESVVLSSGETESDILSVV